MDRAIRMLEDQNNVGRGGLNQFLERNSIPPETMMSQVRAQIAWTKLINRRLRPRITIGDDEVDDVLARIEERQGELEYHLSEILLTFDRPEQELRSEEHTSELQSLMRISYAVFCLKK